MKSRIRLLMAMAVVGGALGCAEDTATEAGPPEVTYDPAAVEMPGLLAYLSLDGDAEDSSERANHGTVVGAVPSPDRFGRPTGALLFDGEDDHVIFDQPILGGHLTDFSLSVWFRTGSSERGAIFHEGEHRERSLWLRSQPGKETLVSTLKQGFDARTEGAFNDDRWHHMVVTAQAGTAVQVWIDGALRATGADDTLYEAGEPLKFPPVLGRMGHPGAPEAGDYFSGQIDDLAAFDHALTGDEVQALLTDGPNRIPSAHAGPDQTVFDLQASFDGSASVDDDGTIAVYRWEFGDGSEPVEGATVSHTFSDFGHYTVTLTTIDDAGGSSTDSLEVSVWNPLCTAVDCEASEAWSTEWASAEMAMVELVNQRRAAGAVCDQEPFDPAPPVEMDGFLRIAARLHSLDMAVQNYFSHTSLDGRQFSDRLEEAGFQGPGPIGENIAAGSHTPEEAVEGWMNSPGHCRNIMDPTFRVVGFGYAYTPSSDFGHYWTQTFGGGH